MLRREGFNSKDFKWEERKVNPNDGHHVRASKRIFAPHPLALCECHFPIPLVACEFFPFAHPLLTRFYYPFPCKTTAIDSISIWEPASKYISVAIPPPAQKTFDAEGENLGTRFAEILADSERGDQKSVFVGSPISRRDDQGRMQKRLSSRSSGTLESVGSGGGSDSELIQCAEDTDERLQKKSLLAGITSRFRRNGICRSVGISLQLRMSLRSGGTQRPNNAL
jgi:hypothetical protein